MKDLKAQGVGVDDFEDKNTKASLYRQSLLTLNSWNDILGRRSKTLTLVFPMRLLYIFVPKINYGATVILMSQTV